MKIPCSGVILAGGMSTRFSGINKAFISINGKTVIERIYEVLSSLFEEIILVTNDPVKYVKWNLNVVTDLFPTRSSLTGIHAGLFFSNNPYAFFTACDTPFLKKELIKTVLEGIAPDVDIIIPEVSARPEPLCAIYSKKCFKLVESQLINGEFKIQKLLKKIRVKKIPEKILRKNDHDLSSFININTPDDLAEAQKMLLNQDL